MFDAKNLATHTGESGDYVTYEIAPADLYPATVARIQEALADGGVPEELIDPAPIDPRIAPAQAAQAYMSQAAAIPADGWRLALLPRSEVTKQANINLRAQALELARRWYTRALHMAVGAPLGLHILLDEDYRL